MIKSIDKNHHEGGYDDDDVNRVNDMEVSRWLKDVIRQDVEREEIRVRRVMDVMKDVERLIEDLRSMDG